MTTGMNKPEMMKAATFGKMARKLDKKRAELVPYIETVHNYDRALETAYQEELTSLIRNYLSTPDTEE